MDNPTEKTSGMQTGKSERGVREREAHDARLSKEQTLSEKCPKCQQLMFNHPRSLTRCARCGHEWAMKEAPVPSNDQFAPTGHAAGCQCHCCLCDEIERLRIESEGWKQALDQEVHEVMRLRAALQEIASMGYGFGGHVYATKAREALRLAVETSPRPSGDYVLVSDMVEGSHPEYGAGLFATHNAVRSAVETSASQLADTTSTGLSRESPADRQVGAPSLKAKGPPDLVEVMVGGAKLTVAVEPKSTEIPDCEPGCDCDFCHRPAVKASAKCAKLVEGSPCQHDADHAGDCDWVPY